jgi:CRISPR/Cas system-associated exonuclease Cas4 (RecB family)
MYFEERSKIADIQESVGKKGLKISQEKIKDIIVEARQKALKYVIGKLPYNSLNEMVVEIKKSVNDDDAAKFIMVNLIKRASMYKDQSQDADGKEFDKKLSQVSVKEDDPRFKDICLISLIDAMKDPSRLTTREVENLLDAVPILLKLPMV